MNAVTYYGELVNQIISYVKELKKVDMFLVQSAVTCCALFWLLHRAWLTLWKPVPELISILGVEVPDPPAVSLAGIKADSVTLHWTRPGPLKPVVRYLIQVNGVNIGDSSRLETAITVTGLRPGHFYNVRVIAVGSNNFQAGSGVIRLRTYGRDGRPHLANGAVPANLTLEDQQNGALADSDDDSLAARSQVVGIETAAVLEGTQAVPRELGQVGHATQLRRNTINRKHSPSSAAADQAAAAKLAKHPEESMQQLTEKFEAIRKETEDVTSQVVKDVEDYRQQLQELTKEKEQKKQILKEKEEASEKLKKEVNYSERANRQAQNRKSQREKLLKEKQAERTKKQDEMVRWKREIEDMKKERDAWAREKETRTAAKEAKVQQLEKEISKRQKALVILEEEIRMKGLQIKELEAERKSLPGAQDDDESRARDALDAQLDQDWVTKERKLTSQLHDQSMLLRRLQEEYHGQQAQYSALSARYNPTMDYANSSGVDFDNNAVQSKTKSRRSRHRKSRTNTISSPSPGHHTHELPYQSSNGPHNSLKSPSFVPGPYFDLSNDTAMVHLSDHTHGMSEAEIQSLTAGAPLSPNVAASLLPADIFADEDPPSPRAGSTRSFGPDLYGQGYENEAQSPTAISRSPSLVSSPQTSSNNLAMYGVSSGPDYGMDFDKRSLNSPGAVYGAIGSPVKPRSTLPPRGLSTMFKLSGNRSKTVQDDGPALGSLKHGQSQSFPRSDEPEVNRPRRMSISSGSWTSMFSRTSTTDAVEGNAPAPARNPGTRRRRNFNIFGAAGSSLDDGTTPLYPDRDPGSPRPLSIASSDLPRPSTDSAPFGWPITGEQINRNSPLATNWSVNVSQAQTQMSWSRNASRRPSLQRGSSTALSNGLSLDDDNLDNLTGPFSPSPAGPIGTRPTSSHKPTSLSLNPAAPTFTAKLPSKLPAMLSRPFKADKGKGKEKSTEVIALSDPQAPSTTSPTDSRKSRDTRSIHTQNSMAESHESLEPISSTPSEPALSTSASSAPEKSSLRQLLRKGSSSKFNLPSLRPKDSGIFGKKGSSSVANSSGDRDGSLDDFREDMTGKSDSVTSSPMLPSGEWKAKDPGTPKEGSRIWGRFGLKKGKGRENLDVEQSEAETTGTEEEG